MPLSRREFLWSGGAAFVAVATTRRPLLAPIGARPEPVPPFEDPRVKALALRGVDAARTAGATYADVRLTHTKRRSFGAGGGIGDTESVTVGVRALVDGYWGFASGSVLSPEELARLGRESVHQAKTNALGERRVVELAPALTVVDGHWTMPVARDPFAVSPFEIQDFLNSLTIYISRTPGASASNIRASFSWQEKAFASSDGSYCIQRWYQSSGVVAMELEKDGKKGGGALDCLTPAGMGWELFTANRQPFVRDYSLYELIRQKLVEIEEDFHLPVKPVDVGRYDAVFDAPSMAEFVDSTLGRATELDRALGYEANAGGTSYLSNPLGMLGSYHVGAPLLTLMANRSDPGSAAWMQWDDEGIVPNEFPLVEDGVLVDFQTTREAATWLAPYYAQAGKPLRSHGCAAAPEAVDAPLLHTPNLVVTSGREGMDFDALVAGLSKGIAIRGANVDLDFQAITGMGSGRFYEVKGGKRVARLTGAGFLFGAPEFWKGLLALGGQPSARRFGFSSIKGEPAQTCDHSVTAQPAVVKQLTLIEPSRKA